jgi:hypothetical protein
VSPVPGEGRSVRAARLALLLATLLAAIAAVFWDLRGHGIGRAVLYDRVAPGGAPHSPQMQAFIREDAILISALVARNADSLVRRPHRIFDPGHCFPATHALALTDPLISLGLLGVPAWITTGDPVATYNVAHALLLLLSALAMVLLVRDWTGVASAGLVAGLLYAFAPPRLHDVTHSFLYDTSWALLGIFFARRLFAAGRWRDALGLALCGALQLGTSLYAMLASLAVALPFAAWLFWHYRLRSVRPLQLLAVVAGVGIAAAFVFASYAGAGGVRSDSPPLFAAWRSFAPGGTLAPAWTGMILALVGLGVARRRALRDLDGDPRWAIALGALLAAALSTGWLYGPLSSALPGLEMVRVPARVASGVQLGAAVLAGIGVAALLRPLPAYAALLVAALLVCLAAGELLWLPRRDAPDGARFAVLELRPPAEALEVFDRLEALGNEGPVLELPDDPRSFSAEEVPARRILLSAYHGRRTSACFGSLRPPGREPLLELFRSWPGPPGYDALRELGFTTIVVDGATLMGRQWRRHLELAAADPALRLRPLHANERFAAWALDP